MYNEAVAGRLHIESERLHGTCI